MIVRRALPLVAALTLAGCVSWKAEPPAATFGALTAIQRAGLPSVGIGSAKLSPDLGAAGRRIVIRGSSVAAPPPGNFADYLLSTIEAELRGAARFDAAAPARISVMLTECHSGENMATGEAAIAATLSVERAGRVVFTRPYRVTKQWTSGFMGVVAIPQALNGFTALFPELVARAFADPEFVAALKG